MLLPREKAARPTPGMPPTPICGGTCCRPTSVSTTFRQRYPIAPLWHEFSYANVQVNNLRNTLRALLKGLASGSVTVNDIDNFL